jgi:hypothetical protein
MDSYTTLALDWLAGHPNPEAITSDPRQWAEQMSAEITNRIRQLVVQLAPTIPGDCYSRARRPVCSGACASSIQCAETTRGARLESDRLKLLDCAPSPA